MTLTSPDCCSSSCPIWISGVGELVGSRRMREPVTTTSPRSEASGSWAGAVWALAAAGMAAASVTAERPASREEVIRNGLVRMWRTPNDENKTSALQLGGGPAGFATE